MTKGIAQTCKGSHHAGCGDEVAVEDSPCGRESPQHEYSKVDADDAEDGRAGEGLRRHESGGSIWRGPRYGKEV